MTRIQLLRLVSAYSVHTGLSEATISNRCVGQARLFSRLKKGQSCTIDAADRTMEWFAANWPADLPWPAEVPRPKAPRPGKGTKAEARP